MRSANPPSFDFGHRTRPAPPAPDRSGSLRRALVRCGPATLLLALVLPGSLLVPAGAEAAVAPPPVRAFVVHSGATPLTTIDAATRTVAGTVPGGPAPTRLAFSPVAALAYVTSASTDTVTVVDTALGTVVATLAVGDAPGQVVVAPDGARLYLMLAAGTVQVVDAANGAQLASVPVGASGGMALSPDGSRLYVAAGLLHEIDTAAAIVIRTTSTGAGVSARDVALTPDGTLAYVTHSELFAGGLAVVDTTTGAIVSSLWLGSIPGQIAMAPDGSRAYVAIQATFVDTGYGAGFLPGRTVAVIDTAVVRRVADIDLGADGVSWTLQNTGSGLAVAPDRSAVYVSVPRLSAVLVADVNTNQVVASVPVAASPGQVLFAPAEVTPAPFALNAVDDSGIVSVDGGTAIADVLANDQIGGVPVTTAHVSLTLESTSVAGVTLDTTDGSLDVAAGTSLGTHALVYRICDLTAPASCDTATATVVVRARTVVDAVDDVATVFAGRQAVADVLANDSLDDVPADHQSGSLSQLSSTDPGVTLDPADGSVDVAATTPAGAQTLVYRLCETASPTNCDDATVNLTVEALPIVAGDDAGSITRAGGSAVADVLANDLLGGVRPTLATVGLTTVSSTAIGVSLTSSGSVAVAGGTPAGTHSLVYRICQATRPTNCDEALVTVTVTPYAIDAVNDSARGSSKTPSTVLASVLTNDVFGGAPATTGTVVLSQVSSTNRNVRLDTIDGSIDVLRRTSSGLVTLVYSICDLTAPTSCDQATVSVDLSGRSG